MKTRFCRSDENAVRLGTLQALIAFAFAVLLQQFLTAGKFELPQKKGESLFSLISDDTRMVVSASMMKKVDAYFHGGVREVDCTLEKHVAEMTTCMEDHDHHNHEHEHRHAGETHAELPLQIVLKSPFLWINSRIHASDHRHLEKEHSVEMLPWVSAAVVASPHNIQAYESGSYILDRMTGKPELAMKFLEQGIKNNPENVALEISLGELYFNTIKDRDKAVLHFNRALEKSLAIKEKPSEDDLFQRLRIYYYLGVVARDNHDINSLRVYCRKSLEISQANVMTRTLVKWLEAVLEK